MIELASPNTVSEVIIENAVALKSSKDLTLYNINNGNWKSSYSVRKLMPHEA